jgi:hypothetical protein
MGNLGNLLNYMALKKIRLISFLIFGSRKGLFTPLGSFISPREVEAQQSMKGMQLVTRWQFTHPNNAMSGQVSGEISNKSLFLLTVSGT